MAIGTKYKADVSIGTPFETGGTRDVIVTAEGLDEVSGYEGDPVVYTATVKDDLEASLPAAFVASLKINETLVITDQAFDASVYEQATGLLTLSWTVPAAVGTFTMKLTWAKQVI
ncbi:hypothetical protein ES702_01792 [subsurface metagenome]